MNAIKRFLSKIGIIFDMIPAEEASLVFLRTTVERRSEDRRRGQ